MCSRSSRGNSDFPPPLRAATCTACGAVHACAATYTDILYISCILLYRRPIQAAYTGSIYRRLRWQSIQAAYISRLYGPLYRRPTGGSLYSAAQVCIRLHRCRRMHDCAAECTPAQLPIQPVGNLYRHLYRKPIHVAYIILYNMIICCIILYILHILLYIQYIQQYIQ